MRGRDARKISMNLTFLQENTLNSGQLMERLSQCEVLTISDLKRIVSVPAYDRNLELYISVISSTHPDAFRKLLECLSTSNNHAVYGRLSLAIDYARILPTVKMHWPFAILVFVAQIGGFLYGSFRLHENF